MFDADPRVQTALGHLAAARQELAGLDLATLSGGQLLGLMAGLEIDVRQRASVQHAVVAVDGNLGVRQTAQDDQETGQANLYFVPVDVPFARNDLDPGAVTITTAGNDEWLPANMFVLGLDGLGQERPTFLAPLVHIRNWQLGSLSTQAGEGKPTVTLPLVPS